MEAVLKKIKIQTGVLKRIAKEKTMYEKEVITLTKQVEEMQAQGKDEYDIKKRNECLDESKMMVPECEKRLQVAIETMSSLLNDNTDASQNEIYTNAMTALNEVNAA